MPSCVVFEISSSPHYGNRNIATSSWHHRLVIRIFLKFLLNLAKVLLQVNLFNVESRDIQSCARYFKLRLKSKITPNLLNSLKIFSFHLLFKWKIGRKNLLHKMFTRKGHFIENFSSWQFPSYHKHKVNSKRNHNSNREWMKKEVSLN